MKVLGEVSYNHKLDKVLIPLLLRQCISLSNPFLLMVFTLKTSQRSRLRLSEEENLTRCLVVVLFFLHALPLHSLPLSLSPSLPLSLSLSLSRPLALALYLSHLSLSLSPEFNLLD